MPFLGQPLIQRVISRMAALADELIITTNRPQDYAFLNLPLFSDLRPGRGALGGLYTALASANQALVATLACDMPFANPDLLAFQARLLEAEGVDVVIPLLDEGYEPLHAVYRRATCQPAVAAAIDQDQWKLISWFPKVRVRALTAEECRRYDPLGLAFANVNTPQEVTQAEAQAQRLG